MKKQLYQTITGRRLDLGRLTEKEREFLGTIQRKYKRKANWSEFASWWFEKFKTADLTTDSPTYRICQDLESRLGIEQGKVAPPDYRDYLADLIEVRYGSRYRFCKETGLDPGHLSRVLAGRAELSLKTLLKILGKLQASLVIQPEEDMAELGPEQALRELVAVAR